MKNYFTILCIIAVAVVFFVVFSVSAAILSILKTVCLFAITIGLVGVTISKWFNR